MGTGDGDGALAKKTTMETPMYGVGMVPCDGDGDGDDVSTYLSLS